MSTLQSEHTFKLLSAIDVDEVTSNYEVSPNGTKYYHPTCALEFTPFLGQNFKNLEEAENFYRLYGFKCGFDIRRSTETRHADKTIMIKHYLCNRAGFHVVKVLERRNKIRKTMIGRCGCQAKLIMKFNGNLGYTVLKFDEVHNHVMATNEDTQFMKASRNPNNMHKSFMFSVAKANVGPTKAHSIYKEMVGGYSKIGATITDFRNMNRDAKAYIGKRDAQMIVEKFKTKKSECDGFFFDYGVDLGGHLNKLYWADPVCRRNYDLFGDVVSFDATFRSNM